MCCSSLRTKKITNKPSTETKNFITGSANGFFTLSNPVVGARKNIKK